MCGIIGILSTTKKDVGLYIYDALAKVDSTCERVMA
jgi:hypothetical protein